MARRSAPLPPSTPDLSELPRIAVDPSSPPADVLHALERIEAWVRDARHAFTSAPLVFDDEAEATRRHLEEQGRVRGIVRRVLWAIDGVRVDHPHSAVDLRNLVIAAALSFTDANDGDLLEPELQLFGQGDDSSSLAALLNSNPRPYAAAIVYEAALLSARGIDRGLADMLELRREDVIAAVRDYRAAKPAKAVGSLSRILGYAKSSNTEAHRAFREWDQARSRRF